MLNVATREIQKANKSSLRVTNESLPKIVVGIYARYSSDMQNAESANDQISRIKYYAQRKMIRLIKYPASQFEFIFDDNWIIKDEAESGKLASRAGYEAIIQGIRECAFQALIVDDLSRLTRSLGDQIHLYEMLHYRGIELYSLCEGISSEAPNAKTFFQIKGMVNELGNDLNALRTRRGKETRALKGFSTGDCPYGYNTIPTQTQNRGGREVSSHFQIVINDEQAQTIDLIDKLFLKGWGRTTIARELNDRGIHSSKRGWKEGKKKCNWSASGILSILKNPRYSGYWGWGKTKAIRDPETKKKVIVEIPENEWVQHFEKADVREDLIIRPIERWKQILEKMKENKKQYEKAFRPSQTTNATKKKTAFTTRGCHLLTGILKCNTCNGPMALVTGKAYGCTNHYKKGTTVCKNKRLITRQKAELYLTKLLSNHLLSDRYICSASDHINKVIKESIAFIPQEITDLQSKKEETEASIQKLMNFIMAHGNTSKAVKESLDAKEVELAYLKDRIKCLIEANLEKLALTPDDLKERLLGLANYFETDPSLSNVLLRDLLPKGLKCIPIGDSATEKKFINQHNSGWFIQGELAMSLEYGLNGKAKSKPVEEKPSSIGFSQLIGGGEQGIRTLGTR